MNPCAVLIKIPFDSAMSRPDRVTQQRTYARRALLEAAKRVGAPLQGWQQDAARRPLPLGRFHWSISHTKTCAAAVIADEPVGVDIEPIKPRRLTTMQAIADEAEWSVLGERTWPNFFRVWTAKEATLKAHGMGIGYLPDCRVVESTGGDQSHSCAVTENGMTLEFNQTRFPVVHFAYDQHVAAVMCAAGAVQWHVVSQEESDQEARHALQT